MAKKGFGGMPGGMNMGQLMQQAQKMQRELQEAQAEIQAMEMEATAGGGMVTVRINGEHQLVDIQIKPEAVDPEDVELLQDMITAAVNEAERKLAEVSEEKLGKFGQMGGLGF